MAMNPYCLNEEELKQFVEVELQGREIYDDKEEFDHLLESWRAWDTEFICLATIFSRFLEQQLRLGQNAEQILHEIFTMTEKPGLWLTLEGFDEEFVAYFLRHSRDEKLTIDEDLNYLRRRHGEYEY